MELVLLSVGKPTERCVAELIEQYLRRLPSQWRTRWTPIRPYPTGDTAKRVEKETDRLLRRILPDDFVALLDERGRDTDTLSFARWLSDRLSEGRRVVFIVGGPEGVSDALRSRANDVIRLSRLTLQHDIALLVLVEQLYRASTVLKGHPYHR